MADPLVIARHGDDRHSRSCPPSPTATALSPAPPAPARRSRCRCSPSGSRASACRSSWPTSRATSPASRKPGELSPEAQGAPRPSSGCPSRSGRGCPVTFWDVWGEQGHPVRATISDMGPLLLARLLNLNETQEGVLALAFKIADDNELLLLDLKDLRALLQFVGDNAAQFKTAVRQRLAGVDRRDPARAAAARAAGRRPLLRRADARHRRPACRPTRRAAASSTSSRPTS